MFSDEFMLTQAVLEGRKTQTRRICKEQIWAHSDIVSAENGIYHFESPKYKVGEVVAVAQSYRDCGGVNEDGVPMWEIVSQKVGGINAGWDNKRFVASSLMPHQIRITDVRVERLQDISDECCLKEGIIKKWHAPACKNYYYVPGVEVKSAKDVHDTPQEAFAHLINKVSRKDVWQENPYVFVYDFELVK